MRTVYLQMSRPLAVDGQFRYKLKIKDVYELSKENKALTINRNYLEDI